MKSSLTYKGYVIDIFETKTDYQFVIKKDEKIILESAAGYPFPSEAEIQAKLYINRLQSENEGWTIS